MRKRSVSIVLFLLLAVGVAVLALVAARVVAPVSASVAPGAVLLANPGFEMRGVSIDFSAGGRTFTLRRESLPRGSTLFPLAELPEDLRAPDSVSISGTRLGLGWTSYIALRFPPTSTTADAQPK